MHTYVHKYTICAVHLVVSRSVQMCMWFRGQDVADMNHGRMRMATIVSIVYEWSWFVARHTYRLLYRLILAHTNMLVSFNTYSPNDHHVGAGPLVVITGYVCISFATSSSAPADTCNTRKCAANAYTRR